MLLKRRKRYSPTSRKSRGIQGSVAAFLEDSPSKNFFPTSRFTQERRKVSTDKLTTRRVKDSPSSFLSYQLLNLRKRRTFYTTSYPQGQWEYGKAKEAVVRQGWSIATRREREKVEKRKEKDQGRQEGGSSEGKVTCVLNQEFLFLVHEYWGSEVTRLG